MGRGENRMSSELIIVESGSWIHESSLCSSLCCQNFFIKILLILGFTLVLPSLSDLENVAEPLYASVSIVGLAPSVSSSLQDCSDAQSMPRE